MCYFLFFFEGSGAPRDLHVLTHSFPTRRSSDLSRRARSCFASTLALSLRTSEAMSVTRPGRRSLPPLLTAMTRNSEPHAAKTSGVPTRQRPRLLPRSEEHTSELQSLIRNSYAVFCLKQKNNKQQRTRYHV